MPQAWKGSQTSESLAVIKEHVMLTSWHVPRALRLAKGPQGGEGRGESPGNRL